MRQRPSRRSASSSARNVPDAPPPTITISRCDMRGRRLKLVLRETNRRSTLCPAHDVHELLDLLALVGLAAGGNRVLDAVGDVIAQDFLLDASERGPHCCHLRHDVDAVAVFV